MKELFEIWELDDDGRKPIEFLGIFETKTVQEARELCQKHYGGNPNWFGVYKISKTDLKKKIAELEHNLRKYQTIIKK